MSGRPARPFSPSRVRLARRIALAADVAQVLVLPLAVAPPVLAATQIAIDVVVCVAMCVLLRPHWAFLPTVVVEALPVVDVVPFWWAAVRYVTRGAETADRPGELLQPGTAGEAEVRATSELLQHGTGGRGDGPREGTRGPSE